MQTHIGGLTFAVVMAASLATASAAETYSLYSCTFLVRGSGGEMSEIFIGVDAGGKAFTYEKRPGSEELVRVPVRVNKNGPNHLLYTYSFDQPHADGQTDRVDARARIPTEGGKSRVSLRGRGYVGQATGDGVCKLERNVRLP